MSKKPRVMVAMSGGVDSSVAAWLLKEQGYDLIGVTIKTFSDHFFPHDLPPGTCCSIESAIDARNVAVKLDFPHYMLDLHELFEKEIIGNFISEYLAGRTPNPCVLCNRLVKWGGLLKYADQFDCEFIATGHYAGIQKFRDRYHIVCGEDANKEQSYVLWGLAQEQLKRTMLPIGNLSKTEIRKMAVDAGFTDIAGKPESFDICFIPDDNYRAFLQKHALDDISSIQEGNFTDADGKILGKHKGYYNYTVGQRKGLEIALGHRMYVLKIDTETNTVVLGERPELDSMTMNVGMLNMQKYEAFPTEKEIKVRVRYKDSGTLAKVKMISENQLAVEFQTPASAVTPGQSAVFYEDDDLIGGGIILE
ncbi:MAG: tRNA 2-thiouridine(34) synthase MnmA [Bacteroidota bacterium]